MGIDQPFEDEPRSDEQYLVNETAVLDEEAKNPYRAWDIDASDGILLKARAISRGDAKIRLLLMERDEFDHYEKGNNFWVEDESDSRQSVQLNNRLRGGDHIVVVEADVPKSRELPDDPEVTVEAWRSE